MNKGNKIKLIKLTDDRFDGQHPNSINEGFVIEGTMDDDLKVGEALYLTCKRDSRYEWFHTSVVTEIIDDSTFKTLNSTYKIEKIED